MQCFPLFSLLLAANLTAVDYLSLDIEGQELNVLKLLPWDRVDIQVTACYLLATEVCATELLTELNDKLS